MFYSVTDPAYDRELPDVEAPPEDPEPPEELVQIWEAMEVADGLHG